MEKTASKVTWEHRKSMRQRYLRGGIYLWRPDVYILNLGIVTATIQIENEGDAGYTIYVSGFREYKYGRLIPDVDGAKRIAMNFLRDKLTNSLKKLDAMGGE